MKRNNNCHKSLLIIKIFLVILLTIGGQSLKIHNKSLKIKHLEQPVYDQQRYLVELAERQNRFKQEIVEIQNDFAGINMMLNDKNMNKNDKKIKLNQALADQRESLIQAQVNLNIPYELKSCQCLNLTQQKKIQLSEQLNKVTIKIQQLQKVSSSTNRHCQVNKCPIMQQIINSVEILKNYQKIMENTISSKCCKVVKYQYRDNLDTPNWHFGNTTQSQYQAKLYQRQQTSNIKLQPCPYMLPYVKIDTNQCFNCPVEKALFNLGTRICQKDCKELSNNTLFALNITSHICGINTNCPDGQYYDDSSKKCSILSQNYNQSQCPPERPFWDPLSLSCQSCSSQTPYFDLALKKCRKCTSAQKWNSNSRICESSTLSNTTQCNQGYDYNFNTKKCDIISINNDTHSICPPDRPNWNQFTLSCDACNNEKPFYDPLIKQCRICNEQQSFNVVSRQCVVKVVNITCGVDQFYNQISKTCDKRGTTSMCPPSTPFWDQNNFKCVKCPSYKPLFNDKSHECEACPLNSTWSVTYNLCVQKCLQGEQYNYEYKKCISSNKTCMQKQVFNYDLNKCIIVNCNQTKPYWNSIVKECQECPLGYVYNYATSICEKDIRTGNVSVCYEDKPVWNSEYLRCQACSQNTQWNGLLKKCVILSVVKHRHSKQVRNHRLQIHQNGQNKDFIEGQVYGNKQISYQHRWINHKY